MKSTIVDANVILRYLLVHNEIFFEKAKEIFDKALNGEIEICIKEVVITEVVYVLEKFYKVNKEKISETLKNLLLTKGLNVENKIYLLKALDIYSERKLDFVDCILCASSQKYQILTFDKKLSKCIDIEKVSP